MRRWQGLAGGLSHAVVHGPGVAAAVEAQAEAQKAEAEQQLELCLSLLSLQRPLQLLCLSFLSLWLQLLCLRLTSLCLQPPALQLQHLIFVYGILGHLLLSSSSTVAPLVRCASFNDPSTGARRCGGTGGCLHGCHCCPSKKPARRALLHPLCRFAVLADGVTSMSPSTRWRPGQWQAAALYGLG